MEPPPPSATPAPPWAAQPAPQDAYPAPVRGGWTPPPTNAGPGDAQPWMVQFNSQPPMAPQSRRGPWKAVAFGIVGLIALLGAGAGGVNAYAKHSVCADLKAEAAQMNQESSSSSDDDAAPTAADLADERKDADQLRTYGRMLVFSGDLREAVNGLADDEDQMVALVKSATDGPPADDAAAKKELARLVTVVGSVNSHARLAQGACGLPVTGILGD
jgi:hypothetical protein